MWIRVGDKIINTLLVTDVQRQRIEGTDSVKVFQAAPDSDRQAAISFYKEEGEAVFEFFANQAVQIYPSLTPQETADLTAIQKGLAKLDPTPFGCTCGWKGRFHELLQDVGRENVCPKCGRSGRKPVTEVI